MYDIFYVSRNNGNDKDWEKIKSKYPFAQRLSNITTYEEIKSRAFTKMFWVIWDDLEVDESFDLLEYQTTKWDDMYIHVFKNGEYYDGICLFPKNLKISNREFYHRFFSDKKEIDILASQPKKYPIYRPKTYEEYQQITDEMFWVIWPEVSVINDDIFNLYFSHHNSYDRRENHVFKNLCNDQESYLSGIILCSKYKPLSKKEFEKQYLIDKKEHNTVASRFRYPVYKIETYDDYLKIINTEFQSMFWCQWPEIEVIDNNIFDLYFDPNDGKYDHDRKENHVFKHQFNDQKIFVNSLTLFSKEKIISHREFTHRFLIEKKEHDRLVSKHQLYDVVFISYDELNADQNYSKLLEICPRAKRIHKVKGIHQAHIEAAKICTTDMFWVVDGDSIIVNNFDFDLVMSSYDKDCVHVWRSQNPINDLEYGNGGVKLLPRILTLNVDVNSPDMTTSISKKFKPVMKVSNINSFNTDEFSTWRSAFRECCKLASRVIDRQQEEETRQRLEIWCTKGVDRPFGEYAINGAQLGKLYGEKNKNNIEALKKINDFNWLKKNFKEIYGR